MSTFTFGFVISQLVQLNRTSFPDVRLKNLCVKVYARPDLFRDLDASVSTKMLNYFQSFNYSILFSLASVRKS